MSLNVLPACMCTTYTQCLQRAKRASSSLGLGFQRVVNCHVGARVQSPTASGLFLTSLFSALYCLPNVFVFILKIKSIVYNCLSYCSSSVRRHYDQTTYRRKVCDGSLLTVSDHLTSMVGSVAARGHSVGALAKNSTSRSTQNFKSHRATSSNKDTPTPTRSLPNSSSAGAKYANL